MTGISEKQIEDVFEVFHEELIEKGLKLLQRQKSMKEYGFRFDLLFEDKNGKDVVVELKKGKVSRNDIGQAVQYAGAVKNGRVILAAPTFSSIEKTAFEHYGIEYIEFNLKTIEAFYKQINNIPLKNAPVNQLVLPKNIIKEPLDKKKLVDGNVAFKITYNDKHWNGICSPELAEYNIKHRTWCKEQFKKEKYHCQTKEAHRQFDQSEHIPCQDSVALGDKDPFFYAGHLHGPQHDGEPIKAMNIKQGKIAVFTSRKPDARENERFIFFIGRINYIEEVYDNGQKYEAYHCDHETGLYFNPDQYPHYWDFYKNPQAPDVIGWNTGLFRYWTDDQVVNLLNTIINSTTYDKALKRKAEFLLKNL